MKLELENDSLLVKYDMAQKASDELREENKILSSKLKELKTSKKELREKHDKLEEMHKGLTTSYKLLKEEYTNLKINHDNLVLSHELLSNEPHEATNNVVKIDIATSCDDLIIESIEQGSSSKGKEVVKSDNYNDYIKLKNENEKLKKDLEKASTTNTVVIENLENDHDMALENEMLKEENKRLKMEMGLKKQTTNESLIEENKKLKLEKEHHKASLSKFIRGQYLQSELLINTVMKMDRSVIGYLAHQEKKAQAQHQQPYKSKPKPNRCFEYGQEGHSAHECKTPQPLPKHARPFSFNAHYMLRKDSSEKMKIMFLGPPNKNRPKQIGLLSH
jgi:hypothetical protein